MIRNFNWKTYNDETTRVIQQQSDDRIEPDLDGTECKVVDRIQKD